MAIGLGDPRLCSGVLRRSFQQGGDRRGRVHHIGGEDEHPRAVLAGPVPLELAHPGGDGARRAGPHRFLPHPLNVRRKIHRGTDHHAPASFGKNIPGATDAVVDEAQGCGVG